MVLVSKNPGPLAAPLLLALPLLAAPPATKAEEAARFHPPAQGMPAAPRLAGYERRLALERSTPFASLRFRSVGPEVQGGRIVDLDAPRERPGTLFVAFATGGLWRTDDQGGSWTPLFDHESTIGLGAIAVGDARGEVLWAGTGEANSSRTSYAGTGVFKSVDGGTTWRNTGLHESHHVGKVLVDASDPDVVFVAAMGPLYTDGGERGLYRTTDGGRSWTKVLGGPGRTGAIDVAQDPKDPKLLYAALWERDRKPWNFLESGPGSGIFRSRDGGTTWSRLSGGFPQGEVVGRIGLAVTPARPGAVWAVVDNQARRPGERDEESPPGELTPRRLMALTPGQLAKVETAVVERFLRAYDFPKELKAKALQRDVASGKVKMADVVAYVNDADRQMEEVETVGVEVWRSDDAGGTWRKAHDVSLEKVAYSYGYYFGKIWVAPDDAERVFVAGVPLAGSSDGGRTWEGLDRHGVHVDHHALWFDPRDPRHVALGNDGGLNLSWDGGRSWAKVNNLPVGQVTTLALDSAEPYDVLVGMQDNGVLRGPSTYVPGKTPRDAWKQVLGGDGSCIEVDPKDPSLVYAASQFGNASRVNVKTGQRTRFRPRHALGEPPLRYNWVTPFLLSPHSRNVLWFGAQRLFRSFDRGETWAAVSPDLTSPREPGDVPFGTITTVSESPKTFGVLFVGTDEGKVWGTRDGGATWKDLSKGLAKDRWVTRVVASVHDEGTVYAAQSGYRNDDFAPYLFRSTDFGATWTSIAAGLPAEPVNSVREDPKARHLLYAATDLGAFVSLDRGATWNALTGGLPHVPVHDLAVHPKEGDVVVGTHGRSAFVAGAAPLRELTPEVAAKPLHAFRVKPATWERGRGYGVNEFFAWRRVPATRSVSWWASPAAASTATISVRDGKGRVWKEWTASSAAGFNAVDYDLSADPARADANEEAIRREAVEAAEKERAKESAKEDEGGAGGAEDPAREAAASPGPPADEDEEEAEGGGPRSTPPEVADLLADPLRKSRERYLPPGRHTVEVAVGAEKATTRLVVKAPKREAPAGGGEDGA